MKKRAIKKGNISWGIFFGTTLTIFLGYLYVENSLTYRLSALFFAVLLVIHTYRTLSSTYLYGYTIFLLCLLTFSHLNDSPLRLILSLLMIGGGSYLLTYGYDLFEQHRIFYRQQIAASILLTILILIFNHLPATAHFLAATISMVSVLTFEESYRLKPAKRWSSIRPYGILILFLLVAFIITTILTRI